MRTAGKAALVVAGVAALLTIWTPYGHHWQWGATAVLALLVGAALLGQDSSPGKAEPRLMTPPPGDQDPAPDASHRPEYGRRRDSH